MAAIAIAKLFDTIYNAIDNGNFELAEELCSKPEVSKYILGKALLSYCYASLRKHSKAMELAKIVMATKPTEDGVLNALGCTFKTLRAEKEFCECYENAMKIKEMGEPYSLELFYSYGRQFEPKKMQQIAQKLYKTVTDKPYYLFWSVGCMLHQDDLPATMLVVAQKMMHKAFYELFPSKQPSAEELSLYLYILVKQGLNEEALSALRDLSSRPVKTFINDGDHFEANTNLVQMHKLSLLMHKIDILVRLKQLHAVVKECKDILESYPDQWNIHTLLVDCLIQIYVQQTKLQKKSATNDDDDDDEAQLNQRSSAISGHFAFPRQYYDVSDVNPVDNEEGIDHPIEILTTHQQYLKSIQQQCPKIRGPYLAEMHLLTAYVRISQGSPSSSSGSSSANGDVTLPPAWSTPIELFPSAKSAVSNTLVNLLIAYINRFQTKPTCFTDIKNYIHTLKSLHPSGVTELNEGLVNLKEWAHSQKDTLRFLLLQSVPSSSDIKDVTLAVESLVVDDAAEDGDDNDDVVGSATTTSAVGETANSKKNKKKKNKKKAAAAATAAATATVTTTAPAAEDKGQPSVPVISTENDLIILHLCSYCKLDQVEMYCTLLLHNELEKGAEMAERLNRSSLYDATKGLFAEGVNGEKRNVLPGDELLLLNSASHRLEYINTINGKSSEGRMFVAALRWAAGLTHGVESSPYSFGFKLDLLEPLRELTIGEASVVTYNGLGAKHIQYDTMSYLLVPSLVESGLFLEAMRHNRQIVNFHMISKRETQDMVSHSFDFANYMKGLELKQFIEKCQKSTQLAMAKAELPTLEITGKYYSAVEALNYLQEVDTKVANEAQKFYTLDDMNQLVDNMDYDLLVRPDIVSEAEAKKAAKIRRQQIIRRITIGQCSTRVIFSALIGDLSQCQTMLKQIISCVSQPIDIDDSNPHAKAGVTSPIPRKDIPDVFVQWDQRVMADRAQKFEIMLWKIIESSLLFGLSCKTTNVTSDVLFAALKNLFDLREYLLDANIRYLVGDAIDEASVKLLSPDWLRCVSYFLRTMVVWCPLQLQTSLATLPYAPWPASEHPIMPPAVPTPAPTTTTTSTSAAANKKKKGKKGGAGNANNAVVEEPVMADAVIVSPANLRWPSLTECVSHINSLPYQQCAPGESMKLFAEVFFDLMEQLYNILGHHFNQLNHLETSAVVQVLKAIDTSLAVSDAEAASWEPVVDQLISSHKMTCERFREQLKTRMDVLRIVLCKKTS